MADRSGFNRFFQPTLGDMLRIGVGAKVACNRCQCERVINLEMLIAKVGPSYSLFNRRCRCKLLPGCQGWNYFLHDRSGVWLPFRDAAAADRWLAG
ncbi:hypothetical protein ATM17_12605 [Sphingopyxis macrogoltabida]|uniref:Uncharacterized protein n=1 Tax=Sphingopyxis macrogoltabida TaxID=33050 RepID=A0AAC8Z125_SPHMC|nr:hypothetical protein LH19_07225 [Sphingopyxis macrogoltabida]AMU89876.1 hypothetical protein ATM17_12605 [Sphingopyxis macrogoltabida]